MLSSVKGLRAGEVLAVVGLAYTDHPVLEGKKGIQEAIKVAIEAVKILELVRYANIHNQKPLVDEELKFIAKYPDIAEKIFAMNPERTE